MPLRAPPLEGASEERERRKLSFLHTLFSQVPGEKNKEEKVSFVKDGFFSFFSRLTFDFGVGVPRERGEGGGGVLLLSCFLLC